MNEWCDYELNQAVCVEQTGHFDCYDLRTTDSESAKSQCSFKFTCNYRCDLKT